jgi:hypothetical protein
LLAGQHAAWPVKLAGSRSCKSTLLNSVDQQPLVCCLLQELLGGELRRQRILRRLRSNHATFQCLLRHQQVCRHQDCRQVRSDSPTHVEHPYCLNLLDVPPQDVQVAYALFLQATLVCQQLVRVLQATFACPATSACCVPQYMSRCADTPGFAVL